MRGHITNNPTTPTHTLFQYPFLSFAFSFNSVYFSAHYTQSCSQTYIPWTGFCYRRNINVIKKTEHFQALGLFDVIYSIWRKTTAAHTNMNAHTYCKFTYTNTKHGKWAQISVWLYVRMCFKCTAYRTRAILGTNTHTHTPNKTIRHIGYVCMYKCVMKNETSIYSLHTNTHNCVENESSKSTLYIC